MPNFTLILNDDGSVRSLLRDGELHDRPVVLEPAYGIVSTYFRLSARNIGGLAAADDDETRRFLGLQAFLMALTGVEAFTNVFFDLRARDGNDAELAAAVAARGGSLLQRLETCISLSFADPLDGWDALLVRLRQLFTMRAQIVHPRWDPTSATIGGLIPLHIGGLAVNFQAAFEDTRLCREAFLWCVLLVIRVAKAAEVDDVADFCRLWTGQEDTCEEAVMGELGLPNAAADIDTRGLGTLARPLPDV